MLQFPVAHGRGSDNQCAIGNRIRDSGEEIGLPQNFRSSDGGTRFAKGGLERIHNAQGANAEIAHGPRCCAYVERVTRRHQNDAQTIEMYLIRQANLFYRLQGRVWSLD